MKQVCLRLLHHPAGLAGVVLLSMVVLLALSASWIYPDDPWEMVAEPNLPPLSAGYLFGTDTLGRDVAAGVAHGARVSLLIGAVATGVAVVVGITLGGIAGYCGGVVDDGLMRFTEIFQTIPGFLLALLMVAIFGPSLYSMVGAIATISWPSLARLVRAEFLSLRTRDFVKAAVLGGQSGLRIVVCQILPNTLSPIVVAASLVMATAILLESAISFLGLGDRSMISWGFMIGAGRSALLQSWWLSAIPGTAIFMTVLGLNLLGDALNQVLNPRQAPRAGLV